mmetsp:Transcript_1168/g.1546  ORF Transcript_1168/g.1546 Transcript_1168/m.1546 type:complete len:107 (+) Transcript_1168:1972-2292(+)|eukprot:CAMPEP_0185568120 /NCGR_PEP_ID=MMETSP0434-20130131/1182_1 /TAXON_ID=626734 ORGANISM="Favella taraikaensis, Strain Fe Narragansett Bay" /NCGR_SAMPLE_ID=MMETSP0434 /ASSEMBLY_ACC=CAM_ASM_000379 /LENGTH=106 /DNA_ID=CAMNT_0028182533 /DNA_START=1961 /DNA_END=2281 /DNA_ORIENTATION=-
MSRIKPSPSHYISRGGGIVSDNRVSPIQSSKNDIKDTVDAESFAVSMLQTTFEVEEHCQDIRLRRKRFDTLHTDQNSVEGRQPKVSNSQQKILGAQGSALKINHGD